MEKITNIKKYRELYIRGLITEQELSKMYEKIALDTSARVEKYMAAIKDSAYLDAPDAREIMAQYALDAREIMAQLYILWKLGLIPTHDYDITASRIENTAKKQDK